MHTKRTGLSRIETLILAGIILAIPAYLFYSVIRDHRVRGLVGYASLYTRDIETEMNAYFEHHGEFPPDLESAGIADVQRPIWWDTGKKLTYKISVDRGFMTFEFIDAPSAILGETIIFKSSVSENQLSWACVGGTIKAVYQPSECKE